MKHHDLTLISGVNSIVGEGPVWDHRAKELVFLDIRGKCIWKMRSKNDTAKKIDLPQQIGCMAICEDGDLLVACEDAVYRMNSKGELLRAHQEIVIKGRRFNDGKVGPDGSFYLGTTDNNGEGAFYRLKNGTLVELFDQCSCSNGLDWTKDGRYMYYIDSPKQMIELFDFDVSTGTLSNRRKFMDIPVEWGLPDGMTLDENDDLWVALWGGHRVIHIDKNTKEVVEEIQVPCPKASCCAFGGEDMEELIITTAAFLDIDEYPEAGYTWKAIPGVKGKAIYYYKS